jgi:uncharacterized protein (TIGR03000 family)
MLKRTFGAAVALAVVLSSASTAEAGGWLLWWKVYRMHHHHSSRVHGSYGSYGSFGLHHWGSWGTLPRHLVSHWRGAHWAGGYDAYGQPRGSHRGGHGFHGRHGHRHRGWHWGHGGAHAWMNPFHGDYGYPFGGYYGYPYGGWYPGPDGYWYGPAIEAAPGVPGKNEVVPAPVPNKVGAEIRFQVSVPNDAVVFVNDELTTSTGELRQFISRNLDADAAYDYTVRAEVERNGQRLSDVKFLTLAPGDEEFVAFDFPQVTLATSLVLHVPADARVWLAGMDTQSTGERREFQTDRLTQDQWANYPIRVELTRDGRTLVREETITLNPGDRNELAIDFTAELASSR